MEKLISRRELLIGAGLTGAALLTAGCQVETPVPTNTHQATPTAKLPESQTSTPTLQPTLSYTPTEVPTEVPPTELPDPDQPILDQFLPEITRRLEDLSPYNTNLIFSPRERPRSGITKGADTKIPSASLIKVPVVLCALDQDPGLSLEPGSDAYRALVSSRNTNTALLLKKIGSFDIFNRYLHERLGFPTDLGLTEWNYPPTLNWSTTEVDGITPGTTLCAGGFSNPYTLSAAMSVYDLFENTEVRFPQKDRLREVLSIPDPEYPTPLDLAIRRAQVTHPDVTFFYYGKNGTLGVGDWALRKYFLSEAVILFANDRIFNLAYSSETSPGDLLDAVLATAAALSV